MSDDNEKIENYTGENTPEHVRAFHTSTRDEFQHERDLVLTARLHLHGYTQEEIAQEISKNHGYSISPQTISRDLQTIKERWRKVYLEDFDTAKARELAHIDELEKAYWTAWERSMRDKTETKSLLIEDKSGSVKGLTTPMYERKRVESKKVERDGSAEFLSGIQWCVEQRCNILGLKAPQKYEIDWRREAQKAGINTGEIGDIFNAMVGQFLENPEATQPPDLGQRTDEGSLDGSSADSQD